MGTRALRKLREHEWEKQLAANQDENTEESEDDEPVIVSKPKNAFDLLNDANEDIDDQEDESLSQISAPEEQSTPANITSSTKAKKKKKKPKKKAKSQAGTPQTQDSREASEDEIDKALKELKLKNPTNEAEYHEDATTWEKEATRHLAIESKNLDPVNEMRGLFGNIAIEDQPGQPRQRMAQVRRGLIGAREEREVDLQTALSGRYSPVSRGKALGNLAKRRNCFMHGKEEWPLATSGGLSMEALPVTTFSKRFNFIHNEQYKIANWQFRQAVESMQSDAMIATLQKNPYHVACLLQVSEIAKYQGDSSLSGDLLERALFTLGRSVHSSFPAAMREGLSRIDFSKPANRELYLAIWRYIRNLEQRGTWKTAFEWSKILLQLDTTSDPYGVTLMIDQLALRGRQHEQFLHVIADSAYGPAWSHLPNICISKTLALLKAQKPREARQQLALAISRYPYILSALASSIEVSPMPKSIWGKTPSTDAEKLYTELYVTRAKDLWNTPETIGLISEVANTMQYYKSYIDQFPPPAALQISLEEARHVMALEIPSLIALLPRDFTNMPTSSVDVLPPPETGSGDLTQRAPTSTNGSPRTIASELLERALGWFFSPANRETATGDQAGSRADSLQALRQELGDAATGISDAQLQQLMEIQIAHEFGDLDETLGMGSMAGGFPEDDDDEAMPDLESIPDTIESEPAQPGRPHAATVEEDEEDEQDTNIGNAPASGALLRRVDSDEELIDRQRNIIQTPEERPITSTSSRTQPVPAAPAITDDDIEENPQRLQRWLIGAGVTETKSISNPSVYLRRLKMLNKNQQIWTMNMLKQRGEADFVRTIEQVLR